MIVFIAAAGLSAYVKLSIVVQLHCKENNDVTLFIAGAVTQLGSLLGAILFFVLVYFTDVYK